MCICCVIFIAVLWAAFIFAPIPVLLYRIGIMADATTDIHDFSLAQVRHIHCIGIGGIGVSALAKKFLLEGKKVSGSDRGPSAITEALAKGGASIFYGHDAKNMTADVDAVMYTKAIDAKNPELVEARKRNIPAFSYSQMLGLVSAGMRTVAVAGSHGKTTTTGMIAWALLQAKKDPTVVVGSLLTDIPTNFIAGKSNVFVVEACEYQKSFLDLTPSIAIITNIDDDHLDYYKTFANIKKAFREFALKVPKSGYIIADMQDPVVRGVLKGVPAHVVDYASVRLGVQLKLAGEHNRRDAQAAYAALRELRVSVKDIRAALASFSGTARRFEYKGEKYGVAVYDDYAHHPTEIKASLAAARERCGKGKLICVFQPHLYSRTKLLFKDFVKSFDVCDEVVLLPIYAAREKKDSSISSRMLFDALKARGIKKGFSVAYVSAPSKAADILAKHAAPGEMAVIMGAGDVTQVSKLFLS